MPHHEREFIANGGEDMAERVTHGEHYAQSDESSLPEIGIAKAEGIAYGAALEYLTKVEASDAGQKNVGDYIVAYAIEDAEGMYHARDGRLEWHDPREENCHLEISVRNAADGRFIPCLNVKATLIEAKTGREIGSHEIPFLWHPWVYHYGRNWVVPSDGTYHLRVHIDEPAFSRHDFRNGDRFREAVDVEFEIQIKRGQKLSLAA